MPKKKRELNTKAVFRIFWEHTKMHPWFFGATILGGLTAELSNIIGPIFVKDIFNIITQTGPIVSSQLFNILKIYAVISLIGWAGGRTEIWLGYTLISKVNAALTKEAFKNLIGHSYQYFATSFSGALTRRVTRFSGAYENLYNSLVIVMFEAVVYIVGISGVLFYRNWMLGSIMFFWIVVFVFIQWRMSRWQHPLRLARAEEDTNLTASLADAISNQNTVTLFSGNRHEDRLVGGAADKFQIAQLRSWNFNTLVNGFQGLLAIGLNVGMLWLGVFLVREEVLTIGDLVLIQTYVFGVFNTVWSLGRQFQQIYTSLADANEMVQTMETPYDVKDKKDAKKLKVTNGEVWFDDVSFSFADGARVLKDFNLAIKAGEKIALVGPSGAGKTTVTKLLLRLYDVNKGGIHIDGQNIADVTQDSLRDAIGFVPQEPILFHRSLMENIRYGRRDASDAEVIEAAKKAHCHEFISQLKLGYETFVGERGIKLSGGERQRVAIARAILKDAPLLVLDEATSSLDSESEMLIQDALETLMKGKTVIVIAHRLSTIMKMDRIVVMQSGSIVAEGTHLELISQKGLYQKLWSIQAGGFLQDDAEAVE